MNQTDSKAEDGCWNCRHWEHGTQNVEMRAEDREKGYSADCKKLESFLTIRVGGNRFGWGSDYNDEIEVSPTFKCLAWETLKNG